MITKDSLVKRMEALDNEFKRIQAAVLQGEKKLVEMQGSYAELKKLCDEIDKEAEKPLE